MTHRLIQLTDCHLFADRGKELRSIATWPRFVAVLSDLRMVHSACDLLVLTGDTAHDEELATYVAVGRELEDWRDRVRIVPGNHDHRDSLRQLVGNSTPDASGGVAGRVTFQVRWDDWTAIGLDSQRPGELPGSLGEEQLAWLRECLVARPGVPTILFLHHPPVALQSPWLDKIGLQDAAGLAKLLHDYPQVRLICCGHVHQESSASLETAAVFTTPAVGPQFRPRTEQLEIESAPPGYRVVDLHPGGSWSTRVVRLL